MVSINDYTKLWFSRLLHNYADSMQSVIKITKAFSLAIKAHENQLYKYNKHEPYVNHPLRVALILTDELSIRDVDTVCTALLHDVFEKKDDTKINDLIRKDLGEIIYNNIKLLVKPKKGKEKYPMQDYFKKIQSSPVHIRYIKLADRLDNIRSLKNTTKKDKIIRYREETQKYLIPIAEITGEKILLKLTIGLYELK